MLQRRSLEEPVHHWQRWSAGRPTPLADRPCFVANQSPVMRANHHQRAKFLHVPKVVECARLVFPLVR
jgi:hypothetical protein